MARNYGNFEMLYSVKGDGDFQIVKYKSTKTDLTVVTADVKGPIVCGHICLATEAHDDDGLPHTLEHLVFMGSEDYPYKGVLDLLANRCLASGTDAWTGTNHTCYTMTTAGSEGFLNLLPVYLEHILYPTLTKSAYITEVHHVNGEGKNAGVVYCEMQARQNTDESRCHLEMVRNMYPGYCGYKSETGGIMKNLRESTSHYKVRSYHKDFYRPDNLSVIITGYVEPDKVFASLQPLEEKIVSKGPLPRISRPWQSQVPPLEASVIKTVPYPSDNESHGMVKVAWRGPKAKDFYNFTSLCVLFDYLHDSPISLLQQYFVEDRYCSKVHCSMIENSECCIYISFQNVLKEKLFHIYHRLTDILNKLATGQEKIDMTRMYTVIHRKILERLSSVEDHPHDTVAHVLIGDFLFGDTKEDLETRTSVISMLKDLKSKQKDFWVALINQYFIGKPNVVIIGEPSKALMEEIGKTETERVAVQQKDLGEDGLKKMEGILKKATEENKKEPPDSIIKDMAVPNVNDIYFHPISLYSNHRGDSAKKNLSFPLANIPFQFQLDDIDTNFVQISALLDSSGVPQELRYYLPLFCEVLFESPVDRDEDLISYEEAIQQLQADTLMTDASLGIQGETFSCGSMPQVVQVILKVELEKYKKGVAWLTDLLYNIKFTAERLRIVAKRLSNDIAEYKNRGCAVVRTLLKSIIFSEECNHVTSSMLKQQTFLMKILQDLDAVPRLVESRMKHLLEILTQRSNLTIHMSADTARLAAKHPNPLMVWKYIIQKTYQLTSDRYPMKKTSNFVLPLESSPEKQIIVGVGSVESSYLIHAVPCIDSYSHPEYPAIMVFIQYLTQVEGPMWRQIRGLGLSYRYSIFVQPESGLLYFLLAKSTHIVNAFKEARDIVKGYADGEFNFSEIELESAKSSLTFEVIEKEKTVSEASKECLLSYYRGVSHTYNRDLLQKISEVSIADLQRVGEKYMAPLFDVSQIRCAVCCHPSKVDEITKEFKELSIELKVLNSLEEDFLCRL